jgi:plastocyanin
MDNETLFYIFGGIAAVSAVIVTFAGLKLKNFPGRMFPLVVVWFAAFAVAASTFSVLQAKDHEAHQAHEHQEAEKLKESGSGPYENEGGALGGEREELEEEAEQEAEGPEEEEEVGPVEGPEETPEEAGEGKESSQQGGGGSDAEASATTLQLAADETAIAFDKTELSAKPGKVTIDFTNPSAIPHNVVILEGDKELAGFEPITEGEESVSADLEAGEYEFICSVPGHPEAGMKGTLTVE